MQAATKEQYVDERYKAYLHYWSTLGLGVGSLVILMLIPLDAMAVPAQFRLFFFYRLIAAGILFLLYLVNRSKVKRGLQNGSVVTAGAVVGVMVAAMIHDFNGHESPYFAGFILDAIFVAGIIPISFGASMLAGLLVYSLYLVPILAYDTITNLPFFLSANILVLASIASLLLLQYFKTRQTRIGFGFEYEQRVMEEALRESEERYRTLVENAADIVFKTDVTGHFTFVNPAGIRIIGYKEEEIIGKHYREYIRPDMRKDVVKFLASQLENRVQNTYYEFAIITKEGHEIWLGQNTQLIVKDSRVSGFQAAARDITERKHAQEALHESEERFRNAFSNAPIGIALVDVHERFLQVNQALCNILGYGKEQLLDTTVPAITHPDDLQVEAKYKKRTESGEIQSFHFEKRYIHADGHIVYGMLSVSVVTDEAGNLLYYIGQLEDITERKHAEEALRESETRYRLLAENATDIIWTVDMDMRLTFVSPSVTRLMGFTVEEAMARTVEQAFTPAAFEKAMQVFAEEMAIESAGQGDPTRSRILELELVRKDGSIVSIEGNFCFFRDSTGKAVGILAIIRDITERKRAEEELRLQELQLRTILDSTGDGILAVDNARRVIKANRRFADLWKIPSDLLEKRSDEVMLTYVLDQLVDPGAFLEKIHALYKSSTEDFDTILFKDGRVMERYSSPLLNESAINGRVWSFRDITERKRAEAKLQASLGEKETLLKEIHHRVKNNLQVISSLLSLQSQYLKDEKDLEMFRTSENRVRTMALVHNMLYQSETLSAIDYNSFIRDLVEVLLHAYRTDSSVVKINVDVHDIQLDIAKAVPCGLILNELISNTLKHAFPGEVKGEISLSMRLDSDRIVMKLQDTGVGFPETIDFRNTQSLGLQLVNVLVEQINGTIELIADGGTTFTITFPISGKNKR